MGRGVQVYHAKRGVVRAWSHWTGNWGDRKCQLLNACMSSHLLRRCVARTMKFADYSRRNRKAVDALKLCRCRKAAAVGYDGN